MHLCLKYVQIGSVFYVDKSHSSLCKVFQEKRPALHKSSSEIKQNCLKAPVGMS